MVRRILTSGVLRSAPRKGVAAVAFLGSLGTAWLFVADVGATFFAATPISGKARAGAADMGWAEGRWCGVFPDWNDDKIAVDLSGGRIDVTIETAPIAMTDGAGRPVAPIPGTRTGPATVAFWLDGATGAIRRTEDGGYELWALTVADTLATIPLVEESPIQKEFTRCG